jgi:hypothetical protein
MSSLISEGFNCIDFPWRTPRATRNRPGAR